MFITTKNLEAKLAALKADFEALVDVKVAEKMAEFETQIQTVYENAKIADRTKRYESDEPFVEIMSEHFTPEGGVALRLDWNTSFIEYLMKNGFTGSNESEIVDHWMYSLSQQKSGEDGKSEFAK